MKGEKAYIFVSNDNISYQELKTQIQIHNLEYFNELIIYI